MESRKTLTPDEFGQTWRRVLEMLPDASPETYDEIRQLLNDLRLDWRRIIDDLGN